LIDQGLGDQATTEVLATKFFELFMVAAAALAVFSAARFTP
jgi:hypothetical protein